MRSSAHTVVTVTTPLSVLPYRPRYCRPTCAVFDPVLAVPAVIDHQHPRLVRRRRRVRRQQLQPPGTDPVRIRAGLGHKELQPLHRRMLRPRDRLGPGQRRQRLVPLPRRQQPGQVLPEPPPLRHTSKKVIKPGRIPLQRARRYRTARPTSRHHVLHQQVMPLLPGIPPTRSRVNKPPLSSRRGDVVLTDLAAEMLDIATRRANAQGITNFETKVCSADDLPFGDVTFDSISVTVRVHVLSRCRQGDRRVRAGAQAGRGSVLVGIGRARGNPWTTIAMQAIATEAVLAPPDPDGPGMFRCAAPGYVALAARTRAGLRLRGDLRHRTAGAMLLRERGLIVTVHRRGTYVA